MSSLNRITLDPAVFHGKPCVRNMRWSVEAVLDMVSWGIHIDEILADHPELKHDDITACLAYARLVVSGESVKRLA